MPRTAGTSDLSAWRGSAMLLVAWLLFAWAMFALHGHLLDRAYQRAQTLAAIAASQATSVSDTTERQLHTLADSLLLALEQPDPDRSVIHEALRQMQTNSPSIALLFLLDRNGKVLEWSRSGFAPSLDLAQRDYFRAHIQGPHRGLYVGRVRHSDFPHDADVPFMTFSSRVVSLRNETAGVLVAYLNEQPFHYFYQSFGLEAGTHIRLLRNDGSLLLEENAAFSSAGAGGLDFRRLRPDDSGPGRYRGRLGGDADTQLYSLAHISRAGLVVAAGVDHARELELWRQLLLWGTLALCGISVLLGRHMWLLRRLILAHRGANSRLADSEYKMNGLLQSVPDGVWSTTADGARLRYVSPAALMLFGIEAEEFGSAAYDWMNAVADDDRQQVSEAYLFCRFAEGQRFELTYRIRGGDGFRWVLHRAWGVTDSDGALLSVDNIASDVTEQQNSLIALRDRERELLALLESLPFGALFFKDGLCYANPAARELLGGLYQPELQPSELFERLQQGGEATPLAVGGEFRVCTLLRPGLPTVFVRAGWRLVARGNLWLIQDVSDSERQARLSSEEESAANIGGWEQDLRTGQMLWSPQLYRLHEASPETFLPDENNILQFYSPASVERLRTALHDAVLYGHGFSLDLEMNLPSRTTRTVHLIAKVQLHQGKAIRLYGALQDITERVRTMQALERQTQSLVAAEQIAGMGSWEWRPGEEDILWSSGALSLHGVGRDESSFGITGWLARVHLADRDDMRETLERLAFSRTSLEWVYRALDARLRWRQIAVKTRPELDANGQVRLVRGTLLDITEARALNETLTLRNRAIESLTSGVLISDLQLPDAPIIYASPAVSQITGYRNEELIGRNCRYLQGDDHTQPEIAVMHGAIARRKPVQVTLRNYRNDGSMFWNELALAPVPDEQGDIRYYIGILTDVTARRRNEEMLLEMQQRLRSILDTAADAIVVADQRGNILLFSHAAEVVFGYQADEVLGRNVSLLMPSAYAEQHNAFIERYVSSGQARVIGFGRELVARRKDGREIPIEISVSDWLSGEEHFFTSVIRDTSERQRMQRQLLQSQKLDALGQLAGGVAHDFNNLLGVVVGNLDILATLLQQQPALLKRVNTALQAAERGAALTTRLLNFARSTPAQVEKLPVVDLNQIIRDIDELLGRPLGPQIEFELQLATQSLPVRLDPAELQNAVLNLALNARDAMPDGGKLLVVTRSLQQLEAQPELPAGDYVEISVTDTGGGIPDEVREHIFEPFFTTKPKGKGTGLGLPMVYSYVKRMHGAILVDSRPGYGTTMRMLFPRAGDSIELPLAEPAPAEHRGKGRLILLVDDEPALLEAVGDQLEAMGYRTLRMDDPINAKAVLARHADIALLLTDILMPRMSGTELARAARALRPDLPILLYTGFPDKYLDDELLKQPRVLLLSKPMARAQLVGALRQLLP